MRADAQPVARSLHRSGDREVHAQPLADRAQVERALAEGERGVTGSHREPIDPRQLVEDLVGQAVGEVLAAGRSPRSSKGSTTMAGGSERAIGAGGAGEPLRPDPPASVRDGLGRSPTALRISQTPPPTSRSAARGGDRSRRATEPRARDRVELRGEGVGARVAALGIGVESAREDGGELGGNVAAHAAHVEALVRARAPGAARTGRRRGPDRTR